MTHEFESGSMASSEGVSRDSEKFDVSHLSGVTSHKKLTRECANFHVM